MRTSQIASYYDFSSNTGHASRTINGKSYWVACTSKAASGEAFYDESDHSFPDGSQEQAAYEELRAAAHDELKSQWNYNGSQWSAPVAEPDEMPSEDDLGTGSVKVEHTEFHGGGKVGWFSSREAAEAWIDWRTQGTDCICGCYVVTDVIPPGARLASFRK